MVGRDESHEGSEPLHRGRIQAQGGGTEVSVAWAQPAAPTLTEMLGFCDTLEGKLAPAEREVRRSDFAALRKFLKTAASHGGISGELKKSFREKRAKSIRVDLEVRKGKACVSEPDKKADEGEKT
jgi:hypothetical protein